MIEKYEVRIGGLMRCCLSTLEDFMARAKEQPKEGDTLLCRYHCNNGGMIFRNGAWEWNRPETEPRWAD